MVCLVTGHWLKKKDLLYERCDMRRRGSGVGCGVVECMKRCTLRWFGHIERMENEESVKKEYRSSVEGPTRRGRPLGKWEDRVKEYASERGVRGNGLEWATRECMGNSPWAGPDFGTIRGGKTIPVPFCLLQH